MSRTLGIAFRVSPHRTETHIASVTGEHERTRQQSTHGKNFMLGIYLPTISEIVSQYGIVSIIIKGEAYEEKSICSTCYTIWIGLMILFGSLNWIGLTLVCCTIFFSGVFVVCIQSLIESILTSRGMTPEEQETPPEEGHEVK